MTKQHEKFKSNVKVLRYYFMGKGWWRAHAALELGLDVHTGLRKDGVTPEFAHQVEIALYLLTLVDHCEQPEAVIASALLHDSIEDYPKIVSFSYLQDYLQNDRIAEAVVRLDKTGKSYDKYFAEIANCPIASIAKGADRIHNVRTMRGVFTEEKQKKYVAEVREYFLPMLKEARRKFPQQAMVYENMKFVLLLQIELIEASFEGHSV